MPQNRIEISITPKQLEAIQTLVKQVRRHPGERLLRRGEGQIAVWITRSQFNALRRLDGPEIFQEEESDDGGQGTL